MRSTPTASGHDHIRMIVRSNAAPVQANTPDETIVVHRGNVLLTTCLQAALPESVDEVLTAPEALGSAAETKIPRGYHETCADSVN